MHEHCQIEEIGSESAGFVPISNSSFICYHHHPHHHPRLYHHCLCHHHHYHPCLYHHCLCHQYHSRLHCFEGLSKSPSSELLWPRYQSQYCFQLLFPHRQQVQHLLPFSQGRSSQEPKESFHRPPQPSCHPQEELDQQSMRD